MRRNILEIEVNVICSSCGRLLKEVSGKKGRMVNPLILKETVNLGVPDESTDGGNGVEEGESKEIEIEEKKPAAQKPKAQKAVETPDEERARDEGKATDPVKVEQKKRSQRTPGAIKGVDPAVKNSKPTGDIF